MDDVYYKVQQYVNNEVKYYKQDDDDFYTNNDDGRRRLAIPVGDFTTTKEISDKLEEKLWNWQRELDNGDDNTIDDSILSWNMCRKIYKYGYWCDSECRSLGNFRMDEWTASDIFLLAVMCIFITSIMGIILMKRIKSFEMAIAYAEEDDAPDPGIPPLPMGLLFFTVLCCIIILASLQLANETLLIAVITCIVLSIYMTNVTFF